MKTKILFICIGSTCRSPMATAMIRALYNDSFESLNAGISCSKSEISDYSKQVISEYFNLKDFNIIPNSYVQTNVDEFDFQIVLDEKVYKYLLENTTSPNEKLIPMFVADPFGGDKQTYLNAAKEIELKFSQWADKIKL